MNTAAENPIHLLFSGPSIVCFDTVNKTFFREIAVPMHEKKQGVLKNFFLVNPQTNTFCLITDRKEEKMTLWHLQLSLDGQWIGSLLVIVAAFDQLSIDRVGRPRLLVHQQPELSQWSQSEAVAYFEGGRAGGCPSLFDLELAELARISGGLEN